MNNTAKTKSVHIVKNRTLRIVLNGKETLKSTIKHVTVAVITINVDVTAESIFNAGANAKIIKLLIRTTRAPGSELRIMFHKNLPLTCLLFGSSAKKNDGTPMTK